MNWEYLIARCLVIVVMATVFATILGLQGCGGGGDDPPAKVPAAERQVEQPPCKAVPPAEREGACTE